MYSEGYWQPSEYSGYVGDRVFGQDGLAGRQENVARHSREARIGPGNGAAVFILMVQPSRSRGKQWYFQAACLPRWSYPTCSS